MAVASACAVLGVLVSRAGWAYRQAAGIEPPNSSSLPFIVRVSSTIVMRSLACRMVSAGSAWEMPSTDLFSIAATTEAPAPTPITAMSLAFRPPLAAQVVTSMAVCEPGAVTPNFMPLMSAGFFTLSMTSLRRPIASCMPRPIRAKPLIAWPRCCMRIVCS